MNNVSTSIVSKSDSRKKPSKWQRFWKQLKNQRQLQIMALLGVAWLIVFCYLPMYGIVIAFKDFHIAKPIADAPWVGFEYFKEFLQDEYFWQVMKNTLGISALKLLIAFPLPIVFALMLNELTSVKFKKFVQTVSYLPHFLSWVILGGIMLTWFSDTGILSDILLKLGLIDDPTHFLATEDHFWTIAVWSEVWKELGWSAIIYIAAMTNINPELYEAAMVDGAGRFRRMWNITLPCIMPTIALFFVLAVGNILNSNFDQILVLRNSLNAGAADVIDVFVYQTGIREGRFEYATAIGLFKAIIAFGLLYGANMFNKKVTGNSII